MAVWLLESTYQKNLTSLYTNSSQHCLSASLWFGTVSWKSVFFRLCCKLSLDMCFWYIVWFISQFICVVRILTSSRCFRAETADISRERGIYRVHQFTKVRRFVWCQLSVLSAVLPRVGFGAHVCYHCRVSPPRFLAECRKRRLNQGSFVFAVF